MSSICERTIKTCIAGSCTNPIYSGIEGKAYIFNRQEIEKFTFDTTTPNPNLITEITMDTYTSGGSDVAYTGYQIKQNGKQPFTGTTTSMTEGNVMNKFTENVSFVVPDNSPAAAMLLDNIANGRFVVILVNEYEGQDGKGKYQVFGSAKGLVCSAMERDAYSEDTDGGWSVTLTAEGSPKSAVFLEHTTTSGGETVVDTKSYLETITDDCED